MQNQGATVADPNLDDGYDRGTRTETRTRPHIPATRVGEDVMTVKDRVRW